MKNTTIALILLALTGCTSIHTYQSPPQNYRLKNSDNTVLITGELKQTRKDGAITTTAVSDLKIYFDGKLTITGFLDKTYSGDFVGIPYDNKKTSASCSSKVTSASSTEVRCIVFIDNERTVTLTF